MREAGARERRRDVLAQRGFEIAQRLGRQLFGAELEQEVARAHAPAFATAAAGVAGARPDASPIGKPSASRLS